MAKENKESGEEKDFLTGQPSKINTDGVDYFKRVKIKVLEGARYHRPGEIIEGSEVLLRKMEQTRTGERAK
jgi:hypothetical protein